MAIDHPWQDEVSLPPALAALAEAERAVITSAELINDTANSLLKIIRKWHEVECCQSGTRPISGEAKGIKWRRVYQAEGDPAKCAGSEPLQPYLCLTRKDENSWALRQENTKVRLTSTAWTLENPFDSDTLDTLGQAHQMIQTIQRNYPVYEKAYQTLTKQMANLGEDLLNPEVEWRLTRAYYYEHGPEQDSTSGIGLRVRMDTQTYSGKVAVFLTTHPIPTMFATGIYPWSLQSLIRCERV